VGRSARCSDLTRELLSAYFDLFRNANHERWDAGKSGKFCTNVGAAALIRVLGDVITYMSKVEHEEPRELHPKQIVEHVEKYLEPCPRYFKQAGDDDLSARFQVPFGRGGPPMFQHRLRELIHTEYPTFRPEGFENDLRKYDEVRRQRADQRVREIQECVHRIILAHLRREYPAEGDDYLIKAVPNKEILKRAMEKRLDADDETRKDLGTYLDFVDLRKIVENSKNWDLFKNDLSIQMPSEPNGRSKYVGWFDDINKLRRVSAHPYNRGYDDMEIQRLDLIYEALNKRGVIRPRDAA
jgi:hypothetical protein